MEGSRILLIVLALVVVIQLAGYVILNMGGSTPGSGTGEIITEPTP